MISLLAKGQKKKRKKKKTQDQYIRFKANLEEEVDHDQHRLIVGNQGEQIQLVDH